MTSEALCISGQNQCFWTTVRRNIMTEVPVWSSVSYFMEICRHGWDRETGRRKEEKEVEEEKSMRRTWKHSGMKHPTKSCLQLPTSCCFLEHSPPPEMVLAARDTWLWGEHVNGFTLGSWILVPALALFLLAAFSRKHHVSPLSSQALGSDALIYSLVHVDWMVQTLTCVCSVAVLTPAPFRSYDMKTDILPSSIGSHKESVYVCLI